MHYRFLLIMNTIALSTPKTVHYLERLSCIMCPQAVHYLNNWTKSLHGLKSSTLARKTNANNNLKRCNSGGTNPQIMLVSCFLCSYSCYMSYLLHKIWRVWWDRLSRSGCGELRSTRHCGQTGLCLPPPLSPLLIPTFFQERQKSRFFYLVLKKKTIFLPPLFE